MWRVLGVAYLLLALQSERSGVLFARLEQSPELLAVGGAGGALLICGGWWPAVYAAAIAMITLAVRGTQDGFVADEYVVQAGLPVGCVVYTSVRTVLGGQRAALSVDRAMILGARAALATSMFLAGFHKLNVDFFDPSVSCSSLASRLDAWWGVGVGASPTLVVALELAAGISLVGAPVLGGLIALTAVAGFGHTGPAAFGATIVALCFACFRASDGLIILAALRRWYGPFAGMAMAIAILSWGSYRGPRPWLSFLVFEQAVLLAGSALLVVAISRVRFYRREWRRWQLRRAVSRQRRFRMRRVGAACLVAVLLSNGMTPYLGLKYRYSFAMLSNLRADRFRSNSLLMPQWLRRWQTPHVAVLQGEVAGVPAGLYLPDELAARLRKSGMATAGAAIVVEHEGREQRFPRAAANMRLFRWLESLPSSRFYQPFLPADTPQPCVH